MESTDSNEASAGAGLRGNGLPRVCEKIELLSTSCGDMVAEIFAECGIFPFQPRFLSP
jgi:hypothetical protein